MPDWLANLTLADLVGVVVAVAAAGTFVAKAVLPMVRWGMRVKSTLDDWSGKPAEKDASGEVIHPAQPSMLARMESMEGTVIRMEATLQHLHELVVPIPAEIGETRREMREGQKALEAKQDEANAALHDRGDTHSKRLYAVETLLKRLRPDDPTD